MISAAAVVMQITPTQHKHQEFSEWEKVKVLPHSIQLLELELMPGL